MLIYKYSICDKSPSVTFKIKMKTSLLIFVGRSFVELCIQSNPRNFKSSQEVPTSLGGGMSILVPSGALIAIIICS